MKTYTANLPDSEVLHTFLDGSVRNTIILNSAAIGLGTYLSGWRWSEHAGPQTGKRSENHIGYILSGAMVIRDADGLETRIGPGDGFEVLADHDAWVVGDEPCVALDFTHVQTVE